MICCRVVTMILLFIFTAAVTLAQIFPQLRANADEVAGIVDKSIITMWYFEQQSPRDDTTNLQVITRLETRRESAIAFWCKSQANMFTAMAALLVIAGACGFIAFILSIFHFYIFSKYAICVPVCILTFISFACCVVGVAGVAFAYNSGFCEVPNIDDPTTSSKKPLKDMWGGLKLVEGFGLLCASAGGYLIIFILEMFV